jgi:hypothetical protein
VLCMFGTHTGCTVITGIFHIHMAIPANNVYM